jgi:Uma2 family endonuclease
MTQHAASDTAYSNCEIAAQLRNWARADGRGCCFSKTGYLLPDGAACCAYSSWIERTRLAKLSREQKRKFLPLVPDFVVELTSPTDRLPRVRKKMEVWLANAVKLGWLIEPPNSLRLSAPPPA